VSLKAAVHFVYAVYLAAKQYPCCVGLDTAGGIWTGMIIVGSFTFVLCIDAMVLIGQYDRLRIPGCCCWYKEGAEQANAQLPVAQGSGDQGQAAEVQQKGTGGREVRIMADSSSKAPQYAAMQTRTGDITQRSSSRAVEFT